MLNDFAPRRYPGAMPAAVVLVVLLGYVGARAIIAAQQVRDTARLMTHGDADKAPAILRRFGCTGCHEIPGISGADGKVGGSLSGLRKRVYVGGVLNNTSDNLVHWIVSPSIFSPHTAMPVTGISEAEARDVAAYLYSR